MVRAAVPLRTRPFAGVALSPEIGPARCRFFGDKCTNCSYSCGEEGAVVRTGRRGGAG